MMRCDLMRMNNYSRLIEASRKFRATSNSAIILTWRRFVAALLGYDSLHLCVVLLLQRVQDFS